MTPGKHRIFISHSHLDNDFGTTLAQDLRRVLVDEDAVFYDVLGGLHGGETWWEKIVEELTARDVFLLVLSPDAMNSIWVRREINVALNENKYIIPVLHRTCSIRADLKIIQIISFLAPKPYDVALQEVLSALGLPKEVPLAQHKRTSPPTDPTDATTMLIQHMETAFADHDWPDVIRKATYLIKRTTGNVSSSVYRMQAVALVEEGQVQAAQEAFETALALVSDRQLRLTLLGDYTTLLARQEQWDEVLQQANEALHFVPNDPGWLAIQQQAQSKRVKPVAVPPSPPLTQKPSPALGKTKAQWIKEGNALYNLKRYEEALAAYDQAIRLDPNYSLAYVGKGNSLNSLKRYEEAITAYDQAIRLDPDYAAAYINKGTALGILKRYEEALLAYEQAIRLDPNDALAYKNKGGALRILKRHEEAITALDQAIRLEPNDANAYNNKGDTLQQLGKNREAQQARDRAKQLGYSS